MENVGRHIPFFSRRRWGVKNLAPWRAIIGHTVHQFHENDLFTPAAAMSYFGLLTLFPALLVMLVISNRFAAGSEALSHIVEVYPGSREFLRAVDYPFPDWTNEYMALVESALGDAYSEPAADVRGYVAQVKSASTVSA